jgi:hypothetical protein
MASGSSEPFAPDPARRSLERLGIYLLLVLGVALLGIAVTIIGLAGGSAAAVGVGAGTIAAAGFISIFFAVVRPRLNTNPEDASSEDSNSEAAVVRYPDAGERPRTWPPKTSPRSVIDKLWTSP